MVGTARPLWVGLLICAGAGVLSAVFNVGYSLSQSIISSAVQSGNSAFGGSNLKWLLVLGSGALPNLAFCAYLLRKNRTWSNYRQPKVVRLYALGICMGLLWGGSVFTYGAGAPKLGGSWGRLSVGRSAW